MLIGTSSAADTYRPNCRRRPSVLPQADAKNILLSREEKFLLPINANY
jgi:hypothetical protein